MSRTSWSRKSRTWHRCGDAAEPQRRSIWSKRKNWRQRTSRSSHSFSLWTTWRMGSTISNSIAARPRTHLRYTVALGLTGQIGPSARWRADQDQSWECALASEEVVLAIGQRCNPVGRLIAKVNDVQFVRVVASQFYCWFVDLVKTSLFLL